MARTESVMAGLGTPAPDFTLPDVTTGNSISLATFAGRKALLVMFISRHCPYVQHVKHELARLGRDYRGSDLAIVAISSNYVPQYPDDSPESLREMAAELALDFPILYDESQDVAKAYQAACTPDFFLFDDSRRLVYRGQLDSSRPKTEIPVTGADLRAAIDALLGGKSLPDVQRPSLGCNIKWRAGNEPPYYQQP
jgi:peroxiredoxin